MPLQKDELENDDLLLLQKIDGQRFIEFLFKKYYSPLCRLAKRLVGDAEAAEDVVQDVFFKLWQDRESREISTSVKAYLYRAVSNKALNYLEKHKKLTPLETAELPEPTFLPSENSLQTQELEAKIAEALEALPPACKAVFVLSRYEEMSYREIADALQIAPKTVENQLGKALRHFRHYLRHYLTLLALVLRLPTGWGD